MVLICVHFYSQQDRGPVELPSLSSDDEIEQLAQLKKSAALQAFDSAHDSALLDSQVLTSLQRLQDVVAEEGLIQKRVAFWLGLSPQGLGEILKGSQGVQSGRKKLLKRIRRLFDLSLSERLIFTKTFAESDFESTARYDRVSISVFMLTSTNFSGN